MMKASSVIQSVAIVIVLMALSTGAMAADSNIGVLDTVLRKYSSAAEKWQTAITARAAWLFWVLAMISMVWTFGMLALKKADIGEFFSEFIKFTVFTGFYYWLLINGPKFSIDIINSLETIAETANRASGNQSVFSPSNIVDIGFHICWLAIDQSSVLSPLQSAVGIIISAIILVVLALVGVNMLLLIISGWILAYAGVFFLGFGGSRWTSDMAINYYKTVLGIAVQLFTMILLIGIGTSFVKEYFANMDASLSLKDMSVMLVVSVVLLALVNKVPPLVAGIASGGGLGAGGGIGNLGAGAAMAAAAGAGAAAATGAAMLKAGAANIAGGAQALMAAFKGAQSNVSGGNDIVSKMTGGGGGSASSSNTGDTGGSPLASAMGDTGGGSSGGGSASGASSDGGSGDTGGGSSGGGSASGASSDGGSGDTGGGSSGGGSASGASSDGGSGDTGGGSSDGNKSSSSSTAQKLAKAAKVAADAGANLAVGMWDVGKAKAQQRIAQTAGAKVAAAINQRTATPSFKNNSLSGANETAVDKDAEVAAFVDKQA